MIQPGPTSKIARTLARGVLSQIVDQTATRPAFIKVTFPDTSYEMHLIPAGPITAQPGRRIVGTIVAQCRRLDIVTTGGKYVEPVFGRPRRVQGAVVAVADDAGTVTVDAGMAITLRLTDARQKPSDFREGQIVSCDVLDGATFSETGTAPRPVGV